MRAYIDVREQEKRSTTQYCDVYTHLETVNPSYLNAESAVYCHKHRVVLARSVHRRTRLKGRSDFMDKMPCYTHLEVTKRIS